MAKDGRSRGAKVQPGGLSSEPPSEQEPCAGGGPEPSPSAPRQASPCLFLHYTSSASTPSLGAQGCTETCRLGSGSGRDSRVFLVHVPSGPQTPWNPPRSSLRISPWRKTSGAPYWQLWVNKPIPGSQRLIPTRVLSTPGTTSSGREVVRSPIKTEVWLVIFTWTPAAA